MTEPSNQKKDFKDWFDRDAAQVLAEQVRSVYPDLDEAAFVQDAVQDLESLEMLARVNQFSEALRKHLPEPFPEAVQILLRSLPPADVDCENVSDGWHQWPIAKFVETHGLEHYEESLAAMIEITMRFSAEFAIRPFIAADPEGVLADLQKLTSHENPHARRWCSEGTRPRLPWGQRLHALVQDPAPLWPILEALYRDPELYVRRSVANNLNDIAKDHPDLVIERCRQWQEAGASPELDWVIRHALRSLIKAGHPRALELLGFEPPEKIDADLTLRNPELRVGESLKMELRLRSAAKHRQPLIVDFAIHYRKKNGSLAPKVFKWKTFTLAAGKETALQKRHAFRLTTIRPLYPGIHKVEILLNGESAQLQKFTVVAVS